MSPELEAFLLYYTCWHEGDFSLADMRTSLVEEIGEDKIKIALFEFKELRLEREKNGDFRTWHQISK